MAELRSAEKNVRQAALVRLLALYEEPVIRAIHAKWPDLPWADVEEIASEFQIRCLVAAKAHFITFNPDAATRTGHPPRLRTYLSTILDRLLISRHRRESAQKRGGPPRLPLASPSLSPQTSPESSSSSFSSVSASSFSRMAAPFQDPAGGKAAPAWAGGPVSFHDDPQSLIFDRLWAHRILARGYAAVETGSPARTALRTALRPWILAAEDGATSLRDVARSLGHSHNAVRVELKRLRRDWRAAIRTIVLETLTDPADINDELRHLAAVLGHFPTAGDPEGQDGGSD